MEPLSSCVLKPRPPTSIAISLPSAPFLNECLLIPISIYKPALVLLPYFDSNVALLADVLTPISGKPVTTFV